MKDTELVKRDLLRRKINEHFSSNPRSKSLIVETNVGEFRTVWRIVRKGAKFSVTEVETKRKSFIFERDEKTVTARPRSQQPFGDKTAAGVAPASSQAARASSIRQGQPVPPKPVAMDDPSSTPAVSPQRRATHVQGTQNILAKSIMNPGSPFSMEFARTKDFVSASKKLNPIEFNKSFGDQYKVKTAAEMTPAQQQQAIAWVASQNPEVAKASGAGNLAVRGASNSFESVMKNVWSVLTEAPKKPEEDDPEKRSPTEPAEPGDTVGLETDPTASGEGEKEAPPETDQAVDQELPTPAAVPEDRVSQDLQGRTVVNANLQLEKNGAKLTMQLTGLENPATLEFKRDGNVIYEFRGRTSVFKPAGAISKAPPTKK